MRIGASRSMPFDPPAADLSLGEDAEALRLHSRQDFLLLGRDAMMHAVARPMHSRKRAQWTIVILLLVGITFALAARLTRFFKDRGEPRVTAVYIPDMKIVPEEIDDPKSWSLGPGPGRDVLQLLQGRPSSPRARGVHWSRTLTVEFPKLQPGVTVDLAKHDVRVAYWGVREDRGWALKTGTAAGTVSMEPVSDGGVSATYDVKLTAISSSDRGNVERLVTFQGTQVCTPYPGAGSRDMVGRAVQDAHTPDTIHRAAERGDRGAVEKFLAEGVDVNIKGDTIYEEGWTPLQHAAFHGQKNVAQVLLERRARVNATSQAGRTALHEAAWRGNTDLAQLLIAKGADVNAKSNGGLTPLDLATEGPSRKARTSVARLLRKHGGKTSEELDGVKPSPPPRVRINH